MCHIILHYKFISQKSHAKCFLIQINLCYDNMELLLHNKEEVNVESFPKKRQISNLLSTIIIVIACLSVVYLCYFSNHMETDIEKSISPQTDQVSDNNQPSHTEENDLAKIIHDYRFDNGNKATIKNSSKILLILTTMENF